MKTKGTSLAGLQSLATDGAAWINRSACRPNISRVRRPGFTLRELTLALAIGGAVMMAAVALVHDAFDWSTLARHRRQDDQTFFLLSRQLRSDLHVSSGVELDAGEDEGQSMTLALDGGTVVVYRTSSHGISRVETRDQVAVRNEQYRFKRPRTILLYRTDLDNQIQMDLKSITPFAPSEVPLWRSLRMTIGLRLLHQNGEIQS